MSRRKVALDFNMSAKVGTALDSLYGSSGFEFIHMEKLVAGTADDPFWADSFKRFGGHIVLSGDCKIAYRPHQAIAFIDNGFISFFPSEGWAGMKGAEKAAAMIHAWPRIEAVLAVAQLGTCWRIPCQKRSGVLRLTSEPLEPLIIPDAVLETARKQRKSP